MAFEITVGPPHLSVNSGWAVLTCEPDCGLGDPPAGPGDQGLLEQYVAVARGCLDLPDWLPELALSNIRVGPRSVTLRLRREGDGSTSAEIGGDPGVRLVRCRYGERW